MILSDGSVSIALNDDLQWTDRDWSGIVESVSYALANGVLPAPVIIKRNARCGRPMTLASTSDYFGCIQYAAFASLKVLAESNPETLTLTGLGGTWNVQFRYAEEPVSGEPVLGVTQYADDEWWSVVIRLRII